MAVQFNWNLFPSTRLDETKLVTPIGCVYSGITPSTTSETPTITCQCRAVLNPHIKLDRTNGMWWCPFCEKKNFGVIDESLVAVTSDEVTFPVKDLGRTAVETIEVIVLDKYQHKDHLEWDPLVSTISSKLDTQKYLFVTFDEHVIVHRPLAAPIGLKCEETTLAGLFNDRGLSNVYLRLAIDRNDSLHEFLFDGPQLAAYLPLLRPQITTTFIPCRAVGYAFYVVALMLACTHYTAQVLVFLGGPGTEFPGKITTVGTRPRSHHDIEQLQAPFFLDSHRYYLILTLIAGGHSPQNAFIIGGLLLKKPTDSNATGSPWWVKIYSALVEQTGIHEMRPLVAGLAGLVYMFELFTLLRFASQLSFDLPKYLNGELTIFTLPGLKLGRMIGGGIPLPLLYHQTQTTAASHLEKISDRLSKFDPRIGKKMYTNRWKFPLLQHEDTLAVFFDPSTAKSLADIYGQPETVFIQYHLRYWHTQLACWMDLVVTVAKPTAMLVLTANKRHFSDGTTRIVTDKNLVMKDLALLQSFDQHVWAVLLARLLVNKIEGTLGFDPFELVAQIADKLLVDLIFNFGGVCETGVIGQLAYHDLNQRYHINPRFAALPLIFYNLRKNPQLFLIFNSSPDETAFYHSWFCRLLVEELIQVMEPRLDAIGTGRLLLDPQCLVLPLGTWLVLDNIFTMIIFKVVGRSEDKEPLHHSDNEARVFGGDLPPPVMEFLQSPRRLIPKYVLTQSEHSQARFLHLRLNPNQDVTVVEEKKGWFSKMKKDPPAYNLLLTDDISLGQFYEGVVARVTEYRHE